MEKKQEVSKATMLSGIFIIIIILTVYNFFINDGDKNVTPENKEVLKETVDQNVIKNTENK